MDVTQQAQRDLALSRALHDYADRINVTRPGAGRHGIRKIRWVADQIAHMAGSFLARAEQGKGE